MNDIDRMAEILREHRKSWYVHTGVAACTAPGCNWSRFGTITQTDAAHAHHVARLIDAELHPVIETVEQLDALPHESVVLLRGPNGGAIQKRYGAWHWANDDSEDFWSEELADFLPARVLYTPEADHEL